jgi:hypothetical protein
MTTCSGGAVSRAASLSVGDFSPLGCMPPGNLKDKPITSFFKRILSKMLSHLSLFVKDKCWYNYFRAQAAGIE